MSSDAIFVGRDVEMAITSEIGGNMEEYVFGTAREVEIIMERVIVQYPALGREEPMYRRGKRIYRFRFTEAFINTALLRLFSGYERGTDPTNWTDPEALAAAFEDGHGSKIFEDFVSDLTLVVWDGVSPYKRLLTLGKLHPERCVLRARANEAVTLNIAGFAEDFQTEDKATEGSAS